MKSFYKNEEETEKPSVSPSTAVGVACELDTNLIVGQALPVTLLKVQEDYTVYVQPASEDVELKSLELQPGQGVKCVLSNVKETATDEQRQAFTQLPADTYVIMLVDAVQSEGLQVTLFDGEGQLLDLQENEVQSVEKVCPMPILNMHQKVRIAHVSEDGIFLHKIAYADLLADLLQKLYEFYNDSEPVEQEWNNGNLCCAKSVADEQWYRAKILETGEETKVQYVDYGNTEVIPSSHLRQLDASFYTPHALALPVVLHVTWSVPVETLMELAGETEYNAVILRNKTGWIVELVDSSGQSLTEKLVELGFVVALDNSPFKRVVEGGRFAEGSDIPAETITDESIIKTVFLIHVNSPNDFFLHTAEATQLLKVIDERLVAAKEFPLLRNDSISKGKIVAAQFDEDDLWYRAKIIDHSENEIKVTFIDYGNSVKVAKLKELPDDLLKIPALAMNCALVKPGDGEWDAVTSDMFNKLANEDGVSFELKIISDGEPNFVSLYTNGESVAEHLIVASSMSQVDDSNVTGGNAENTQDLQKEAEMQDMIMESVDKKIANIKLEEDMQQIVEDLLANALSSNLGESSVETEQEVDIAENSLVKNDENNEILEDQSVSEVVEGSKHEGEMQDMIMESVDAKIENMQLQEDMQQFVEDSLANALSSNLGESSVETEQEVDSAESSLVKNDENKILDDHSVSEVVEESKHAAEMQDMIMKSFDAKIENMKLQEDMQHVDNFETEKEVASAESQIKNIDNNNIQGVDQFVSEGIKENKHVTLDTSSSNGVGNAQEDEDGSMKNPETSDSVNEAESKACKDVHCCQHISMLWEAVMDLTKKVDDIQIMLEQRQGEQLSIPHPQNTLEGYCPTESLGLPLKTEEEFLEFEEKLNNLIFRQKVTRMLLTLNGNNVKSLAANILRKILSDDVAETFSLTGRTISGNNKKVFATTSIYAIVGEICFKKYDNCKEKEVRECVSDWLTQAKFRKQRREKRASAV
ncbi:tudor domain-containing 6-like [Macrosteles quadrilineatus]|uniref:tudor domain-containing 6-like n=1 Tax=Macrosteles quadrilineatus TaxID=74068 RepID=UPI0023E30E0F|nr:tudor domain-containing 6-like [Macrosteles quadrilineatus]